jgi:PKD repeat protein
MKPINSAFLSLFILLLAGQSATLKAQNCATPLLAPFFEDFDGLNFAAPQSFLNPGIIDPCWSRSDTSGYFWGSFTGVSPGYLSGPLYDYTTGSGQYLYTSWAGTNLNTQIESPFIDLSPLTLPELRFFTYMLGNDIDSLQIEIWNGASYTGALTIIGTIQQNQNDPWSQQILGLNSYTNDTIRVRFTAYRSIAFGDQSVIALDNFEIREAPSCYNPTNAKVINRGSNSLNLSWVSGGATNWNVAYRVAGSTGAFTQVTATTNPFNLTGLSANTTYELQVRDSCGLGDVSAYTRPFDASTRCAPVTAPFTENFDGPGFTPTGFNILGSFTSCYFRPLTGNYHWTVATGNLFNSITGPIGDHTTGSGNYAICRNRQTTTGVLPTRQASLSTELIDLSPLNAPELTFWYHLFGLDIDSLVLFVDNGTAKTRVFGLSGPQQSNENQPWLEATVDLAPFANDTVALEFRAYRNGLFDFKAEIAVDDLSIQDAPTCPEPSQLQVSTIGVSSANLNWISGGATHYTIAYRQAGVSTLYTVVNASNSNFTLTGLTPGTSYEVKVRDSCGINDVSLYTPLAIFTTNCGLLTAPYRENFDGPQWVPGALNQNTGNQISPCWSRPTATTQNFGTRSGNGSGQATGPSSDVSGNGNYLLSCRCNVLPPPFQGEITSPSIFIPQTLNYPNLVYSYFMYGSTIIRLEILISKNGGPFTNLDTIVGAQQTSKNDPWLKDTLDLTAFIGDTIQIKYIAAAGGLSGDIAIDEFSIENIIPCSPPLNLSLQNATLNSIDVSWSSANSNSTANLQYYDINLGSSFGSTITGVSSPYTISNLIPGTKYVVNVFDSCGSALSSIVSDTLETLPCDTVTASPSATANFLTTNFSSTSINADSLNWNFAGLGSSTVQNPTFVFPTAGTYQITLRAFNNCGNSDTAILNLTICDTLKANFSFNSFGDSVVFSSSASQNATGFIWDLDEGMNSALPNPAVKYNSLGTKTVSLTVFNNCGDTATVTQSVLMCAPPIANWTYTILSPTGSGLRIQFDGTLSTGAVSYNWDFGDGSTDTGVTPIHIYNSPSLAYEVILLVTNACGDTAKKKIELNKIGLNEPIPNYNFNLYPNPAQEQTTFSFNEVALELRSLKLLNLNGQVLKVIEVNQNSTMNIPLHNLSSGVYILQVEHTSGIHNFKLNVL